MNNKFAIIIVSLLVGLGLGYFVSHGAKFGDSLVSTVATHYVNGINVGSSDQFAVNGSGAITASGAITSTGAFTTTGAASTGALTATLFKSSTIGASSSSPAALGAAPAGHFIIAASATTASASTTAVTANSSILLQIEHTTPIAGTTCNTAATTTPGVATKVAGNGFTVSTLAAPVTNPLCLAYWIVN